MDLLVQIVDPVQALYQGVQKLDPKREPNLTGPEPNRPRTKRKAIRTGPYPNGSLTEPKANQTEAEPGPPRRGPT